MRLNYNCDDDVFVIHLSEKPIVREMSQDWNTHISYAEDGSVVEITVVDARASGIIPGRYFLHTDTLYIEFRKGEVSETRDLDENVLLDVDSAGQIVAMTFEHARELGSAEALAV